MPNPAHAQIQAGNCGFQTSVAATAEGGRQVTLELESDCEKVAGFARALLEHGPFDAFAEIDPRRDSEIMSLAREHLRGCCEACGVPVGAFKAGEVAAGLALPVDVSITLS